MGEHHDRYKVRRPAPGDGPIVSNLPRWSQQKRELELAMEKQLHGDVEKDSVEVCIGIDTTLLEVFIAGG